MSGFKKIITMFLTWVGIFALIYCAWWIIDYLQFGSPQPSVADSIFSVILTYSLYDNLHKGEVWKK